MIVDHVKKRIGICSNYYRNYILLKSEFLLYLVYIRVTGDFLNKYLEQIIKIGNW